MYLPHRDLFLLFSCRVNAMPWWSVSVVLFTSPSLPPPLPPPTSLAVFFLPIFSVAPSPPSENFDQATVSLNYSVQEGESLFLPIKVPIWLVHTREILNKNDKWRHTMEYSSFSDLNNSDKVLYLLIRLFLLKKILVICLRIISP